MKHMHDYSYMLHRKHLLLGYVPLVMHYFKECGKNEFC